MEICLAPFLPPEYSRAFVWRSDGPVIRRFESAGLPVMGHCHGRLRDVIDMILDIGPAALHPFEAPPLYDGRQARMRWGQAHVPNDE